MWDDIKFWLTGGIYKRAFKRLFCLLPCLGLSALSISKFFQDPVGVFMSLLFLLPVELYLWISAKGYFHGKVVPHWGAVFGTKNIHKLIRYEEFEAYVTKDLNSDSGVEISKSGKWIRCKGYYYPIQLVRGYGSVGPGKNGNLYFIDGSAVYDIIPGDYLTVKAFEELFPPVFAADVALSNKNIIDGNKSAFDAVWKGTGQELATADWGELRYRWEKKYAQLYNKQISNQMRKNRFRMLSDKFNVHRLMFGRVLDDEELSLILDQIEKKRIKEGISRITKLENYSDEYCVCNGIKILDMMGYPKNAEGLDFLFDCIRDVQKPYCNDAVEVLKKYPREQLTERIDKNVNEAYAANDVVWAAGLLILARAIDYEVTLDTGDSDNESVDSKSLEQENRITVVKDENGIERFQVLSQGGVQMLKGFELEG